MPSAVAPNPVRNITSLLAYSNAATLPESSIAAIACESRLISQIFSRMSTLIEPSGFK